MTRPRSAAASAILVSWACACEIEDSSKAITSAKSRSFNDLAGCRLERRGWVTRDGGSFSASSQPVQQIEKEPEHRPAGLQ